jgi:transcription-repair coupling factor (superfamily II helicase)
MDAPLLPPLGRYQEVALPHGSADAQKWSQLAEHAKPLVILTADMQTASRLREEISFFAPNLTLTLLPDWETLTYDHFSAHHDLVSDRLAALWQIQQNVADIILIPINTALMRLPPISYLAAHTFFIKKKQKLDLNKLRQNLTLASYQYVTQVFSPGEFTVRGGLIDLFPMGSPSPYRIELFDEEVESIRIFDVDSQRSIHTVDEIRLLPAREFPLDDEGCKYFRQRFREVFEGDPSRSLIYKDISKGVAPGGIEYYLPLFFASTATLFDYVPSDSVFILYPAIKEAAQAFLSDAAARYRLLGKDPDRPLLPPAHLFLAQDEMLHQLKAYRRLIINPTLTADTLALPLLQINRHAENPIAPLQHFIQGFAGKVVLCAESLGRRETMLNLFQAHGVKPTLYESWRHYQQHSASLGMLVAPLTQGFIDPSAHTAFITEFDLYSQPSQKRQKRQKRQQNDNLLRDLSEIKPGDPVVHEQYGIGCYQGLVSMDLGEGVTELMLLEYADKDKLYIPVSQLHLISRYSGMATDQITLHRLGSAHWEKAKRRAAEKVRDTAAELLNLYAQRAAKQGYAFGFDQQDYQRFTEGFGFEETVDQAAAIEAVIHDMTQAQPMDRLICGDVGFGKTEVALRAAFVAVADGKQVAVLVPTTLLAEQHYQNFADRFADFPVRLAELSRFRTGKETKQALEGLANGQIDIVIGTHKLIQDSVKFHNLGLVIIDEEHRFGVRHKEKLKAFRAEVDVLTLTATPIPRTLALSLEGLRDFSVIATAPHRRLSIKTFVSSFSEGIIREAVLRELKRGGQIFFLHNEVDTIINMQERLTTLLPEARIAVAHGQMRERDLEHVMRDFYQQRFNLLLCTTIIETGIDIPNANTIIMNRADKFGLAQLHQMRGRVGRSHHQAYAYLLTAGEDTLTVAAKKRLEAIQTMEELGSGFYLAMHDLEIRGAGEVLGESQSGEIHEIGFSLYSAMLNEAVNALKNGTEPDLNQPLGVSTEINLHAPALLPEEFCPDIHERLVIYKRLANCTSEIDLLQIQEELIDRFGLLPQAAKTLLMSHHLRLIAKPIGVLKLDASEEAITIQFAQKNKIDPMRIIQLIQSKPHYKLAGQDKLRVKINLSDISIRVAQTKALLQELVE